jgi:hypothetical protein
MRQFLMRLPQSRPRELVEKSGPTSVVTQAEDSCVVAPSFHGTEHGVEDRERRRVSTQPSGPRQWSLGAAPSAVEDAPADDLFLDSGAAADIRLAGGDGLGVLTRSWVEVYFFGSHMLLSVLK